jgi:hypothetical protein
MKAFLRLLMSVLFVMAPLASSLLAQTPVVVSDTQAEQHLGQDVTVEGVVTAVTTSRKGNTFINFSRVYPNQTFTVGFLLAHRWLLTLRYRHCRGRRSRSPEELNFIGGSLRLKLCRRISSFRSRQMRRLLVSAFAPLFIDKMSMATTISLSMTHHRVDVDTQSVLLKDAKSA